MKITLLSIIVGDQDQALAMYRDTLGFVLTDDGDGAARRAAMDHARIARSTRRHTHFAEPNGFPFVAEYQRALKANSVPLTAFAVTDIDAEYARLTAAGVAFKSPPSVGDAAIPRTATFDDRCGNWIMLYEDKADG